MPSSRLRPLRRIPIVRALWALAVVAVACGVSARAASAQVVVDPVTHTRFSISPPVTGPHAAAATAQTSCSTDCTALVYHGGPVQHAEQDYLFFWAPVSNPIPAGYESGLQTWLGGVAAADGTAGNPFSVDTLYYDNTGPGGSDSYVPYAVQDAGTIVDTDAYPASGCTDTDGNGTTQAVCLTDAEIQSELSSYVAAHSLPTGTGVEYFVLTPQGVGSCFDSTNSSCSYTSYCGYHRYMSIDSGASQIVYADMPWAYQVPGCDVNLAFGAGYPNPSGIDAVVSVFSHELSETMTDPDLNAWYDSSQNEIGDKCAYIYTPNTSEGYLTGLNWNGAGYWNVPLAGGDYLMQTEYDQRNGNCEVGLTNTWTGKAALGTGWSHGASWAGALGPSGSLDTLAFPALTSAACTSVPATAACYSADNDVSGLTARAISIDDGVGYSISGDALTLGSGGITATTSASLPTASTLDFPLTLGSPQTWTISGATGGAGAGLAVGGAVSGAGDALQVDLSNQATLNLGADDELGPLTVSGANAGESGSSAAQNGTLIATSGLNGTDGNPVALSDVGMVTGANTAAGPLTSTGSSIQVGPGAAGALSVAGALSLDSASQLTLFIDNSGTTGGSAFSQIRATGAVSLSGALKLASGTVGCPALPVGQADTLITTTGSLSGTFSGVPNGTVLTLPCGSGAPSLQINYTTNSVTATAISAAPSSLSAPAIAGTAAPGQSLTATPGEWTNSPTSVVDQWERCDAAGANCSPIAGAGAEQYTLTSDDLGSTIRIEEVATNATGSTTAWSAYTATVAIPSRPSSPPQPSEPGPVASPSPTPGPTASPTPVGATANATASGPAAPATTGIRAVLLEVLASAGKSARVGQLRTRGAYSVSIPATGAGVIVVSWALRPAKKSSRTHVKRDTSPALVALGRAGAARAGAFPLKIRLTAQGRRLLARRGTLTLTFTVTFTPAGSHQPVTVGRSITVRR
jgi:hypothetical protein